MSEKQQLQNEPTPPQDHVPFTTQTDSQSQPVIPQGTVWPSTQQGPVWPSTQQGPSWPFTQQQPVVVQVIPRNQPVIIYDKYNSKWSRDLGITQIVLGGVAFMLNVIGINHDYGGLDVDYGHYSYYWRDTIAYYIGTGFWCTICEAMFLSTLFLLASIGEFIVCVWSSTLCCKVLCCSYTVNYAAPTIQYAAHPSGQGQIVLLSSQGGQAIHAGGMSQSTGPGYLAPAGVAQAPAYAPIARGPTQAPETGYTGQPFQYQGAAGQQTYPTQQVGTPLQPEPGTPPPAYQ